MLYYISQLNKILDLDFKPTNREFENQWNPYQNPNGIFQRNRTNNTKIYMEPQKFQIAKAILRKNSKARGITLSWFQTTLQSYSY